MLVIPLTEPMLHPMSVCPKQRPSALTQRGDAQKKGRADHLSIDKDKQATDKTLKEFGKCCLSLCDVLHSDRELDEMELLFIDNHLQVLQMAYQQWKRKKGRRT